MSIRWIEGFELLSRSGANLVSNKYSRGANYADLQEGHYFGKSVRNAQLRTPSLGLQDTYIVGVDVYLPAQPGAAEYDIHFLRHDLRQCHVALVDLGSGWTVAFNRGDTVVATSTEEFDLNTWYYLEVEVTFGSSGSYEIRVNEETMLSDDDVNTAGCGTSQADVVEFDVTGYIDHIYIADGTGDRHNTFLGKQVIEGLGPDEDGDTTDWGNAHALDHHEVLNWESGPTVDEVTATAAGKQELVGLENIRFIESEIACIALLASLYQAASIGTRDVKGLFKQHGKDAAYLDDTTVRGNTSRYYMDIQEQNPNEDRPWCKDDIDDGQFGEELA